MSVVPLTSISIHTCQLCVLAPSKSTWACSPSQPRAPALPTQFDGCWEVKPFTQATLDAIYHPDKAAAAASHHHHHNPFGPQGLFGFLGPSESAAAGWRGRHGRRTIGPRTRLTSFVCWVGCLRAFCRW